MKIKRGLIYKRGGTPFLEKVRVGRKIFVNWPMLILDRTGLKEEVLYRTRSGLRFLCRGNTSDVGVVGAILDGREYPANLLRLPVSSPVVLDVGANIGAFSVYLDSLNKGVPYRLFAFEPFVENLKILKINLALNGVMASEVVNAAVLGVDGNVVLDIDDEMGEVTVAQSESGGVAAIRLSTFCRERNIDRIQLIKMDVEGSEYDILEADEEFLKASVDNLIVEYHEDPSGRDIQWIRGLLEPHFEVRVVVETFRTGVFHASVR